MAPEVLVVCEHASNRIPRDLHDLGLANEVIESHVAWDPGALIVARALAERLDAALVEGCVSRLVYDCNRPPEAVSAIPRRSEIYDIPGNRDLSAVARAERVERVFDPFTAALAGAVERHRGSLKVMVTIHSFTPVFNGVARSVEIGVLHGSDDRLALAMMDCVPARAPYDIRLNAPYDAKDGVTHTLEAHGAGLASVMIEIRNDLIGTREDGVAMAAFLAPWIGQAAAALGADGARA